MKKGIYTINKLWLRYGWVIYTCIAMSVLQKRGVKLYQYFKSKLYINTSNK